MSSDIPTQPTDPSVEICHRCGMPLDRPGAQACRSHPPSQIDLIIRNVAEIERDPLPDQHPDEMRVTADELRAILEEHLL